MTIGVSLLMKVISKYAAQQDADRQRYVNFINFMGLDGKESEKSEGKNKEAQDRSQSRLRSGVRDWFADTMKNYLPAGFFSKKNRSQHPWRDDVYRNLGKTLHDKLRYSMLSRVGMKAKQLLGRELRVDEFGVAPNAIDEKVLDFMGKIQTEPQFVHEAINRTFTGKEKDKSPEAEAPEQKTRKKGYSPGMAETWFLPKVSDDLYKRYEKELNDKKDTKYKSVLEKVRESQNRNYLKPEDIGIKKGIVDPYVYQILKDMNKFTLDIHDLSESYDSKKKQYTWKALVSIPEIIKKSPTFYSDILFSVSLPPDMRSPRAGKKIPVSVQHAYDTKGGKRGLSIRFDETYDKWKEDSVETLETSGFTGKESFDKFIDSLSSNFSQEWIKGKNLDEMIDDLGGELFFHGQGFGSADSLAEVVEQLGGRPSTREELKSEKEKGQYEERKKTLAEMVEKAVDSVGEKVQRYMSTIDKDQAAAMKKAILQAGKFLKVPQLYDALKSGNLRIGWNNLALSEPSVSIALDIIFDPAVSPGEEAWVTLFKRKFEGVLSDALFSRLVRLITYKEMLEELGKDKNEVKRALTNVSDEELKKLVPDEEVKESINKFFSKDPAVKKLVKTLKSGIKDIIEDKLRSHPAFKKFWERKRTWSASIKPNIERKVERTLEGDDDIPRGVLRKMDTDIKKKITIVEEITGKGDKTTKKSKVNISELKDIDAPELSNFVENLVEYYAQDALRQAWRKEDDREASFGKYMIENIMATKSTI